MGEQNGAPPLVILGMDAGDPAYIRRWAAEGHLPTIARIMSQGCSAPITAERIVAEVGTGITLLSGVSHDRHGHYDFRQLRPGTYDLVPHTAEQARTVPFWHHLRGTRKRVAVIDPFEAGVQPDLAGVQLAFWAAHQPAFPAIPPVSSPPEVVAAVQQRFGPPLKVSDFVRGVSVAEDRQAYHTLLAGVARKGEVCRHLLAEGRFDLALVMFSEMHWASHRFWDYRPEASGEGARPGDPVLTHAIRDVYRAIDGEMGALLRMLPAEANVIFVGMFGMENYYPTTGLIENVLRTLGFQATPSLAPASFRPLAVARRLIPLPVRRLLGRLQSRDSYERMLANQFRNGTDWSRTTAFSIPSLFDSYVRVNLQGREPRGIVKAGREYDEVLGHLESELSQLIDPVTGQAAVGETVRCVDLFGDVPRDLPDLVVRWRPHTHFLRRVVHPRGEITQQEPLYLRDSYHSMGGLMAAAGPSIAARGAVGAVGPLDLAPSFLSLLGEPIPECMTGKVMTPLLRGAEVPG